MKHMKTYSTHWGESKVSVTANWGQANSPVKGVDGGRQVADFNHDMRRALRAALVEHAEAEGLDTEDAEVLDRIFEAMDEAALES